MAWLVGVCGDLDHSRMPPVLETPDVRTTTEWLLGYASCDVCAGLARVVFAAWPAGGVWHALRNATASRTPYSCTLSVRARPATCRPEALTPVGTRWSTIVFGEGPLSLGRVPLE